MLCNISQNAMGQPGGGVPCQVQPGGTLAGPAGGVPWPGGAPWQGGYPGRGGTLAGGYPGSGGTLTGGVPGRRGTLGGVPS